MKIKFLVVLTIMLSISAFGQGNKHHSGFLGKLDKEKAHLELTDEQLSQIESIQEEYKPQFEALRQQEFESAESRKAAFKKLHTNFREKVGDILTDEQKAKIKKSRSAKRKQNSPRRGTDFRKNTMNEIKTYREQNILPVLKEQRAKLEELISEEDKAIITELRTERKGKVKQMKSRKEMKGQRQPPSEEMKAWRNEKMEKIRTLVKKYEEDIDNLLTEIQPQRNKWKEDILEIRKKQASEKRKEFKNKEEKGLKRGHENQQGMKNKRNALHKKGAGKSKIHKTKMKKVNFLLLDPLSEETVGGIEKSGINLRSYPNPAASSSTLEYNVPETGNIRIALHDEKGNLAKILFEGNKKAGEHKLNIDLNELKGGVYYFTAVDASGIQTTKKLVVSK